jgi:Fic family protein
MSRIISKKRKPTTTQLKKISEILSIDYQELLKEYVTDEVTTILMEYPNLVSEVMALLEERVSYLSSSNNFQLIQLSDVLQKKLEKLSESHEKWKNIKPLDPSQLIKMREYFHNSYTYESNRIEGNTLSLQETHLVINEGITIGGKSMREHFEAVNHLEAIELIDDFIKRKINFNAFYLKQIHQLILKEVNSKNAGIYRNVPVKISGSLHNPPEPFLLEKMMEDYFFFYETNKNKIHSVILAAEMHERLVTIHPFIDGNGRTARLVMNLILLQNGYTIANLKGNYEDRIKYYQALEKVQVNHENEDFYNLIIDHAQSSLDEHLQLAGV